MYWLKQVATLGFFKFLKISIFLFSSRPTRDQRDQRDQRPQTTDQRPETRECAGFKKIQKTKRQINEIN